MKIEKITWEHRNDFHAILRCEHCGYSQILNSGYNDAYYHNHVLPAMKCKVCDLPSRSAVTLQESGGK
jgi:hypothetical protein